MAVFRHEPRPAEPTKKRIVEVTRDGKIVSSEPLGGALKQWRRPAWCRHHRKWSALKAAVREH